MIEAPSPAVEEKVEPLPKEEIKDTILEVLADIAESLKGANAK